MPTADKDNKQSSELSAFLAINALKLGIFKDLDIKISKYRELGLTDEEIITKLKEDMEGIVDKHWYNAFFMPVQTAFMLTIDSVFDQRNISFYKFNTQRDNRVRPSHRLLDGNIYRRNSAVGKRMIPPIAYGCRCYITPVLVKDARNVQTKPPNSKPEFYGTKKSWKLDESGYPTALYKQYLKQKRKFRK